MNETDLDLLNRYTRQHAEDAFAELVRRHLNLVYSAALRQVRSPQLAEEVAQSAFTDLARNAPRLTQGTILSMSPQPELTSISTLLRQGYGGQAGQQTKHAPPWAKAGLSRRSDCEGGRKGMERVTAAIEPPAPSAESGGMKS